MVFLLLLVFALILLVCPISFRAKIYFSLDKKTLYFVIKIIDINIIKIAIFIQNKKLVYRINNGQTKELKKTNKCNVNVSNFMYLKKLNIYVKSTNIDTKNMAIITAFLYMIKDDCKLKFNEGDTINIDIDLSLIVFPMKGVLYGL